jgi:hypothetical protein
MDHLLGGIVDKRALKASVSELIPIVLHPVSVSVSVSVPDFLYVVRSTEPGTDTETSTGQVSLPEKQIPRKADENRRKNPKSEIRNPKWVNGWNS